MRNFSFSLPLAFCVTIATTTTNNHNNVASALVQPDSRRAFLNRAASATTGATMGWVLQQQNLVSNNSNHPGGCACGQCGGSVQQHSASCNCGNCNAHVSGCQCGSCVASSHDAGCNCGICSSSPHDAGCGCGSCSSSMAAFRPPSAYAYEARTVGGTNPSAETAAYNVQSAKTYDRLEKSGLISLDSRADEKARLSDALSSYSYDATPSGGTNSNNNSKNKNAAKDKK